VRRDGGEDRDARPLGECCRFPGAVILVHHHARDTDVATQATEVLHRGADVVRHIERLQVVGADDDHLLAHVARDRKAEAPADHVAQEVEEHEVEAPLVEAELLEGLESMDDAAATAATANFRATQLHREDAVALEADITDLHRLARELLLRRNLDDRGARLATEEETGGIALRVAPDEQHLLAELRHHVGEVGEREALANAALAVDRDNLGTAGDRRRQWGVRLDRRLVAERTVHELDRP